MCLLRGKLLYVEDYTMITGKRRHCTNEGNQQVFHFKSAQNVSLDLEFRVYDDGIAFRYVLPRRLKEMCVTDETTAFTFQKGNYPMDTEVQSGL